MENLEYLPFNQINLSDSFFDGLKADYQEFTEWFNRKAADNESAFVLKIGDVVDGFMYIKFEEGPVNDITPPLPSGRHLKIGTFKFNAQGTRRGERFVKKVFDYAFEHQVDDIYVTIFDKHKGLISLLNRYGFQNTGSKSTANGTEYVLLRKMNYYSGDQLADYPYLSTNNNQNFLLSIYPKYHTRMLPDSVLDNESHDLIQDISHTNSIHKIYICGMKDAPKITAGDNLVIYRTTDNKGPARYRSVATSVGIVEETANVNDFTTEQEFLDYCSSYSVFSEHELRTIYRQKKYPYILKFTYNSAFKKRLTRGTLIDSIGLIESDYWGIMELTEIQLKNIIQAGGLSESIIIN